MPGNGIKRDMSDLQNNVSLSPVRLDRYTPGSYTPGAPYWQQILWYFIGSPLFKSYWFPFSSFKVWLVCKFGAKVGKGVRIKPGITLKFPWRLSIGNYVWLGENVWLDNLAQIFIDDHVCVSQGAYFCTGNHNWKDPNFGLKLGEIYLEAGSWIGAYARIGPGVTVGYGTVLCLGSVTGQSLQPMAIYAGNPAKMIRTRVMEHTCNSTFTS